jgi:hypothetical protein
MAAPSVASGGTFSIPPGWDLVSQHDGSYVITPSGGDDASKVSALSNAMLAGLGAAAEADGVIAALGGVMPNGVRAKGEISIVDDGAQFHTSKLERLGPRRDPLGTYFSPALASGIVAGARSTIEGDYVTHAKVDGVAIKLDHDMWIPGSPLSIISYGQLTSDGYDVDLNRLARHGVIFWERH